MRLVVVTVFALLLAPLSLRAEGHDSDSLIPFGEEENRESAARDHYQLGQRAFEEGRFPDAAREFQAAYDLSQRSALLWNIAKAHRRQFDIDRDITGLRRACAVFENYGQLVSTEREHGEAREALDECRRQEYRASHAASPSPPTPSPPVEWKPVEAPSNPTIAPVPRAPILPAHGERQQRSMAPWILLGSGAAVGIVGLGLGLGAHSAQNTVENAAETMPAVPYSRVAGDYDRGHALAIAAYVSFGVAAALAATSLVLFLIQSPREASVRVGASSARWGVW